jgi:hypothetical protein
MMCGDGTVRRKSLHALNALWIPANNMVSNVKSFVFTGNFNCIKMTYHVLMAARLKESVFWTVGMFHHAVCYTFPDVSEMLTVSIRTVIPVRAPMMEAVSTSETSANFYQTTRRDSNVNSTI